MYRYQRNICSPFNATLRPRYVTHTMHIWYCAIHRNTAIINRFEITELKLEKKSYQQHVYAISCFYVNVLWTTDVVQLFNLSIVTMNKRQLDNVKHNVTYTRCRKYTVNKNVKFCNLSRTHNVQCNEHCSTDMEEKLGSGRERKLCMAQHNNYAVSRYYSLEAYQDMCSSSPNTKAYKTA